MKHQSVAIGTIFAAAWLGVACTGEIGDSVEGGGNNAANNHGTGPNNTGNNNSDTTDTDWVFDPGEEPPAMCQGVSVGEGKLRRLTRTEYDNTVRELLGARAQPGRSFTPDEKVAGFNANSNVPVSELAVEQFMEAAEGLALDAVGRLDTLVPCDRLADEQGCARTFIEQFGRRAYRRPLEGEEVERMLTTFNTIRDVHGLNDAYRVVIQAFLQSPWFLYHVEIGAEELEGGVARLGPYEVASRLSYFLWNSMPDEALMEAAARGELETDVQIEAQARRMLEDGRAREALSSFHQQWLEIERLEGLEKDPAVYPEFDGELRDAMLGETETFIEELIRQGDGKLSTLFTASYTFVSYPLAELYGVDGVGHPLETFHFEAEAVGSDVGGAQGNAWNLWSNGRLVAHIEAPAAGLYRLQARVWGTQAGPEPVLMSMGADGASLGAFTVEAASPDDAMIVSAEVELRAGGHDVFVEFLNDFYDPDAGQDRNLLVDWVSVQGPLGGGAVGEGGYVRVELDPTQRAGLLTHASVLASHAKANQSSPIHRGKFVRERLLCQTLPAPPPDLEIVPPPLDPTLSTRDRFSRHSEDIACSGCHQLMDPIGFGFEHYDGVGRYRAEEGGAPIDATGNIVATRDINGDFDGVVELGAKLAQSDEVRRCVATQWFRFALRRLETEADLCSLQSAYTTFRASDYNIREYLVALALSDAFRYRGPIAE